LPEKNDLVDEAIRIFNYAKEKGILLRLMGSIAFRIHCPKFSWIHEELGRALTDIDCMTLGKYISHIPKIFTEIGYELNKEEAESSILLGRYIFYNKEHKGWHVDVFFDRLNMCHTIDFRGRLEIDSPTVSLADLMLEKLQIVKINEKDIKDVIMLLLEHKIGNGDLETINSAYISSLLSQDWEFYYTATNNLKKIKIFLDEYELKDEYRSEVKEKIDQLLKDIEQEPKSFKWKIRAKIGTKQKWYKDVEDISH